MKDNNQMEHSDEMENTSTSTSLVQRQPQDLWLLNVKAMTHFYLHHIWNVYEFISHSGFHYSIPVVIFKPPRNCWYQTTFLLQRALPSHHCKHQFLFLFIQSFKDIHKSFFSSYISFGGLRINRSTTYD